MGASAAATDSPSSVRFLRLRLVDRSVARDVPRIGAENPGVLVDLVLPTDGVLADLVNGLVPVVGGRERRSDAPSVVSSWSIVPSYAAEPFTRAVVAVHRYSATRDAETPKRPAGSPVALWSRWVKERQTGV